jgi:opacity protein-like surface antigen
MDSLLNIRRWGIVILMGVLLAMGMPAVGFSSAPYPPPVPPAPPPPTPEELGDIGGQMMTGEGHYGTLVIDSLGNILLINRFGEINKDGQVVRKKQAAQPTELIPLNERAVVYTIRWQDLEKATDAQLDEFVKDMRKKSDWILGDVNVDGQNRTVPLHDLGIREKLKQAREAYKFDQAHGRAPPYKTLLMVDTYIWRVEEDKRVEEQKAKREKDKVGLLPTVPGAAATPVGYAAAPNWLKGAYVSLNMGASLYGSSSFNPTFSEYRRQGDLRFETTGSKSFQGGVQTAFSAGVSVGHFGCPHNLHPAFDYLGWEIGFEYRRYTLGRQPGTFQEVFRVNGAPVSEVSGTADLWGNGALYNVNFMLQGRYGFLPTTDHPFGTLQPHVGVGPALVINRFEPGIRLTGISRLNGMPVHIPLDSVSEFNSQTDVSLGFTANFGVRYFPHKNVFVDLSYQYLYAKPNFGFQRGPFNINFDNQINNNTLKMAVGWQF